ncbi:MAG: 6-hydroxymethylpterin diphosphokinase MptE-like protein [Candidatus Hydrogenedentota bacterium]
MFKSNFAILQKRYPALLPLIQKIKPMNIYLQKSRSNDDVLCFRKSGEEVYLFSLYNPRKEAERIFNSFIDSKKEVALIYGTGLEYLIEQFLDRDIQFCVIEDDPALLWFLFNRIDLNDERWRRVEFIFDLPGFYFEEELRKWFQKNRARSYEIIFSLGLSELKKNRIEKLAKRIAELATEAYQNIACTLHFNIHWLMNILSNLKRIKENLWVDDLRFEKRHNPVVVIGAGSSVRSYLEILNTFQDRIWIVAVDTILPTLVDCDIKPDIVVSIDAGLENVKDFKILKNKNTGFILAADAVIHPDTFNYHKGQTVFAITPFVGMDGDVSPVIKFFSDKLTRRPFYWLSGGSVLHNAIYLALYLFTGDIFLLGADFSYRYVKHSVGTVSFNNYINQLAKFKGVDFKSNKKEEIILKNIKGEDVFSDRVLILYKRFLEENFDFKSSRVYNLSEEGLAIKNVDNIKKERFFNILKAVARKDKIYVTRHRERIRFDFSKEREKIEKIEIGATNIQIEILNSLKDVKFNTKFIQDFEKLEKEDYFGLVKELTGGVFIVCEKYNRGTRYGELQYYFTLSKAISEAAKFLLQGLASVG